MITSTGDTETDHALEYQRRRRAHCLAQIPPNRVEAAKCMARVDDILDRAVVVAPDGEAVCDDGGWLAEQASWAHNATGVDEPVLTPYEAARLAARRMGVSETVIKRHDGPDDGGDPVST